MAPIENTGEHSVANIEFLADPECAHGWLVRIDGMDQSFVDLDDPRRLEFDYIDKMAMIIDVSHGDGEAIRAIHIGGAAMTLPRYIAETRPRSPQIVLEPNEHLTSRVRQQLPLPARSGIKVRPVDGHRGLEAMPADYADVIIVDAFESGRVPAQLACREFFSHCGRVLRSTGILIGNYPDTSQRLYWARVLAGMRTQFGFTAMGVEPAILKGRRFGNAVLMAASQPLMLDQFARRAVSSALPYRILYGDYLARLIPNAEPMDFDNSQPSPGADGYFIR